MLKCDVDIRKNLYNNIVCSSGITMFEDKDIAQSDKNRKKHQHQIQ